MLKRVPRSFEDKDPTSEDEIRNVLQQRLPVFRILHKKPFKILQITRDTDTQPEIVLNVFLETLLGPLLYATEGQQKLNFHTYLFKTPKSYLTEEGICSE